MAPSSQSDATKPLKHLPFPAQRQLLLSVGDVVRAADPSIDLTDATLCSHAGESTRSRSFCVPLFVERGTSQLRYTVDVHLAVEDNRTDCCDDKNDVLPTWTAVSELANSPASCVLRIQFRQEDEKTKRELLGRDWVVKLFKTSLEQDWDGEITLWQHLHHSGVPGVQPLQGVLKTRDPKKWHPDAPMSLFRAHGALSAHIVRRAESKQPFAPNELGDWIACLATILRGVHSKDVSHGDFAARNLVLDKSANATEKSPYEVYLIDFGHALYHGDKRADPNVAQKAYANDWKMLGRIVLQMLTLRLDVKFPLANTLRAPLLSSDDGAPFLALAEKLCEDGGADATLIASLFSLASKPPRVPAVVIHNVDTHVQQQSKDNSST